MSIQPLRDKLIVRLLPEDDRAGSIILTNHSSHLRWVTVEAVGPECRELSPGATVLVNTLLGQVVGDLVAVPERSVLAMRVT